MLRLGGWFGLQLCLLLPGLAWSQALPRFKIQIEDTGAYSLGYADLAEAGLESETPSASIGMSSGGHDVPIWLDDGGDGVFGPGDRIEFLGERLHGEYSYSSEYTRYNIYYLNLDQANPARMRATTASRFARPRAATLRNRVHLEQDSQILRLPPEKNGDPEELWYWAKLTQNQPEPFSLPLELADRDPADDEKVDIVVSFRGWSRPRNKPDSDAFDHQVKLSINGHPIGGAQWNGIDPYKLELNGLDPSLFGADENVLSIEIPKRPSSQPKRPLIDVIMLNWVEFEYSRAPRAGKRQYQVRLQLDPERRQPTALRFEHVPDRQLRLYGDDGTRSVAETRTSRSGESFEQMPIGDHAKSFVVARDDQLRSPVAINIDTPSRLASPDQQADYIIIAHPTLLDAIQPLAAMHRKRGLRVLVTSIDDVYDEFSDGVVTPQAIRDFISNAHANWRSPAPRFVLLVGDASWDGKNEDTADSQYADWTYRPGEIQRFGKNGSTPYAEKSELNRRDLIPTWNHATFEGHAASDNYFVTVSGDDNLPDLAIGRLPVVEPEDVTAIVDKTIRYIDHPEVGPWRSEALLVTNEQRGFQRQSNRLALQLADSGISAEKIYPSSNETSNDQNTRRLVDSFDEGELIVHFLGHGGRYIWRTGPPDLAKNHDLFTLDDLSGLAPSSRLPIVLSMTCYSAPFDHPSADSIGEKLIRLDQRGAIAVIAASWRNSPSPAWGRVLATELRQRNSTIGEALMRAKHQIRSTQFIETYNLLGDPAVPVALPAADLHLTATSDEATEHRLHVTGDTTLEGFKGRVRLKVVSSDGDIIRRLDLQTDTPTFAIDIELSTEEREQAALVTAYAWNEQQGRDAMGSAELESAYDNGSQGTGGQKSR
ncbi:MAG: C25 family cysteine peptidase [Chitinophagaceae bacterium]